MQVGTYTEAWSYYFNTSYSFNENNRLEFVALGSPQIHGQSFWNNRVSNYSHELARDMGVAEEDLRTEYGMDYNPRADNLETRLLQVKKLLLVGYHLTAGTIVQLTCIQVH